MIPPLAFGGGRNEENIMAVEIQERELQGILSDHRGRVDELGRYL